MGQRWANFGPPMGHQLVQDLSLTIARKSLLCPRFSENDDCHEMPLAFLGTERAMRVLPNSLNIKDFGAPETIRTSDPCLRRAVLYPTELQALRARHVLFHFGKTGAQRVRNIAFLGHSVHQFRVQAVLPASVRTLPTTIKAGGRTASAIAVVSRFCSVVGMKRSSGSVAL